MNLALFDFDGTITTGEMFRPFLSVAVEPRRLALGKVVLAPLLVAYKLGIVPGGVARAVVMRFCFSGVPVLTFEAACRRFAEQVLPAALRPEAMDRIDWHRSQGDRIVVVSGGLDNYLGRWCRSHQLDLVCSALEHQDAVLTGRYLGAECVGPEKTRRVRERYDLAAYPVIYAYGDAKDDLDMLDLAHKKYYRWQEMSV